MRYLTPGRSRPTETVMFFVRPLTAVFFATVSLVAVASTAHAQSAVFDEFADRAATESAGPGSLIDSRSAMIIAAVGALLGLLAIHRRRQVDDLVDLAATDALTGLANRRSLDTEIDRRRAKADGSIACLMIDVDHFKSINDTHGHPAGDAVLCQVGSMIAGHVRGNDVAYRYGGEEFCLLLSDTTESEAFAIAERLRVQAITLELGIDATVTVSVGVAVGDDPQAGEVLNWADAALRQAKRDGRNRTLVSGT